ncbi:MAG: hypothetical protein K2X03_28705 [Bryobacteraceae bacterium]|nr:hypothetical protein [Bryobacteraceae bacterium]
MRKFLIWSGGLCLVASWYVLADESVFWKQWGDGQAEVAAYDLVIPRYNQLRRGIAVSIFVTESFSNTLRVKADAGKHPASDIVPVMKLNLVKDFQTGVYDYHDMLSAFATLAPANGLAAGVLTKDVYSRQEWCGSTFALALFDRNRVKITSHSYFDGEADQQRELAMQPNGIAEDGLWFWARGWAQPVLAPGEVKAIPMLTSAEHGKGMLQWTNVQLKHAPLTKKIAVDGKQIDADLFTAQVMNGLRKDFYVERGGERRILRWDFSNGERGQLLKSARMKYWELNGKGGEAALKQLGVLPRPPRTM